MYSPGRVSMLRLPYLPYHRRAVPRNTNRCGSRHYDESGNLFVICVVLV